MPVNNVLDIMPQRDETKNAKVKTRSKSNRTDAHLWSKRACAITEETVSAMLTKQKTDG